jgi:solute:Na+ symporter, SSS family
MLGLVDVLLIVAFLAWAVFSGLRARKASSQSLEEYFLAGRTLPGWKAGASMAATQFAADTPLLVTGMIATAGLFSLWRLWIYAVAFLLMGFVLSGAWRRAGVLTDAELAEARSSGSAAAMLRVVKALYFGTVFNCTVLAMVLFAAARIAEPFLTWDQWLPPALFDGLVDVVRASGLSESPARAASSGLSLGVVVAVTALYSTTGGLRAVVNTDLVQLAVALLGTLAYAVIVVREVGGLSSLGSRIQETFGAEGAAELLALTPDLARGATLVLVATIAIQWLAQMNADGTGYLAQRTMACRTARDARQAAIVFVVAQILLRSLLWIAIGLSLLLLFPAAGADAAAREATFVEGIALHLPAGLRGLMLVGLLAALASTIDTHLNWGASYWTHDLYDRVLCRALRRTPTSRELVNVARLANVFVLAIALAILSQLSSIQSAWKASLLLGAGMGIPLLLRWLWWRVTATAELAAVAVSSVVAPALLVWGSAEGPQVIWMAATSLVVVAAVALLDARRPAARADAERFYARARPPGFWGPAAAAHGEDPAAPLRRLGWGLARTAATAAALFSALVALSALLFGSPAPARAISPAAWGLLLLVAAGLFAFSAHRIGLRHGAEP